MPHNLRFTRFVMQRLEVELAQTDTFEELGGVTLRDCLDSGSQSIVEHRGTGNEQQNSPGSNAGA